MKLTFRDLKQQKFVIEAEPSETIAAVKEKISGEKGWESTLLKLIYSGKMLQDTNTVESYNIEEKGYIVCMVSKPKTQAGSSTAASTSKAPSTPAPQTTTQTPVQPPAPAPAATAPSAEVPATPTPASGVPTTSSSLNDSNALTVGAERAAAIANLESMGFPRADIDRAMRAAFNNPDRAVEYLLNGIPENLQQDVPPPRQPSRTPAAAPATGTPAPAAQPSAEQGDEPINLFEAAAQANQGGGRSRGAGRGASSSNPLADLEGLANSAGGAGGAAGAGGLGNLDFLRNNPQFQQLRQIIQTQPRMLEPILQQVAQGNPQLAEMISNNTEQFLTLLSEDADEDAPLPPGAQAVSVTEEEREAIERLCRLGFERDLVIQAYFACDKNEELAANFLFEQPDDDGDN